MINIILELFLNITLRNRGSFKINYYSLKVLKMTMQRNTWRRQKWLVICLFLYSALYLNEMLAFGENRRIFLNTVSSNKAVQKETTICFIKPVNVLNRLECAYRCVNRLPECAAIYYNDAMKLCKLLRCRPTDKLVNENLVGIPSGWELLEDEEGI